MLPCMSATTRPALENVIVEISGAFFKGVVTASKQSRGEPYLEEFRWAVGVMNVFDRFYVEERELPLLY